MASAPRRVPARSVARPANVAAGQSGAPEVRGPVVGGLPQLTWLRLRHFRTDLAWWGYALGVDIDERSDIFDRLYYVYLTLIFGGCAVSSWAYALDRVQEAFSSTPALGLLAAAALGVLPVLVLVMRGLRALRESPVRFIAADAAFIATGSFSAPALALTMSVGPALKQGVAQGLIAYLLAFGAAVSGTAIAPLPAALTLAALSAAASLLGDALGCLRLSISRAGARWAFRIGVSVALIAFALLSVIVSASGHLPAPVPSFGITGASGSGLLPDVLAAPAAPVVAVVAFAVALALLALSAIRMDLIGAIEESGLFAALFGVRRLALTDPGVYRDLVRRQRMSRRRRRGAAIPLGAGAGTLVRRALQSHLRQPMSIIHLTYLGAVLIPAGSLLIAARPQPPALIAWGLLLVMSRSAVGGLSLVFREDARVRLVRDMLPFGTRTLALMDGLLPAVFTCALSLAVIAGIGALAPWGPSILAPLVGLGFTVCLALASAFDGIEIPRARHRPTALVGILGTVLSAGLFALVAPEVVPGVLAIVAVIYVTVLDRAR